MALIESAGQLVEASTRPLGGLSRGRTSLQLYAGNAKSYAEIVKAQPNVRTVVSFIARNIAQLGVHVIRRASDTDRQRLRDHPLAVALRRPNPLDRRLTTYRLIHRTLWDLGSYDVAFWALLPADGLGRPVIIPLRPDRMEIRGHLWPTSYLYHGSRGKRELTPDQVVYFQGSHNLDDPLWGVSPIETLRRIIAGDDSAGIYREQFWRSGARASAVIERPADAPDWSDPARDRFKTEWDEAWTGHGPNAGGTPILEDGMKLAEAPNTTAREAEYVDSRKLSREEAAALYHIAPIWVGISGSGESFASVKERHRALYMDDLGPWIAMLEQDLTGQALPAFGEEDDDVRVRLNIAEKLRGAPEEQAEAINRLVGRPILTPNEGRAWLEMNDRPDGDGLTIPLNVAVGGQTIPGEPAPGTASALDELGALESSLRAKLNTPEGTKAVGPTQAQTLAAIAGHRPAVLAVVERTFERQSAEVLAELGAAAAPALEELFDKDRWDSELTEDLLGLALDFAAEVGELTASALGFDELDTEVFAPFLAENASQAASAINQATVTQIGDALVEDDPLAEVAGVFGLAASARAPQIAQTRATAVFGFASRDTARQAGRSSKVWNVTSRNSRHPQLDGETVPLGSNFSNGLAWPGDTRGDVDEVAGCTCFLSFE